MNEWLNFDRLQASGLEPHYFGLGFIQLKINPSQRLHFWVPQWPAIAGAHTELHDHRYDFASTVLQGRVVQDVYAAGVLHNDPFEGCMELIEVNCKPGNEDTPQIKGYVQPQHLVHHEVQTGQTYRMGHDAFHRAWSVGPTVTLLERGAVIKDVARVLRPVGTPFTCPFSIPISTEACWEQIKTMLEQS